MQKGYTPMAGNRLSEGYASLMMSRRTFELGRNGLCDRPQKMTPQPTLVAIIHLRVHTYLTQICTRANALAGLRPR